jgi:hypothetical protein
MRKTWSLDELKKIVELKKQLNSSEEVTKQFIATHPKRKFFEVYNKCTHPKNVMMRIKKLEKDTSPYLPTKNLKYKEVRDAILSLNLKRGDNIPLEKLFKKVRHLYTLKTLHSLITHTGGYADAGQNPFEDLISHTPGEGIITFIGGPKVVSKETMMVPAKIVHKFDLAKKTPSPFVDEDALLIKDHDLRAEQVQLLKELVVLTSKSYTTIIDLLRYGNEGNKRLVEIFGEQHSAWKERQQKK